MMQSRAQAKTQPAIALRKCNAREVHGPYFVGDHYIGAQKCVFTCMLLGPDQNMVIQWSERFFRAGPVGADPEAEFGRIATEP